MDDQTACPVITVFVCVYTPGIYEVYRGYIVFVFSVKMFVCVHACVCVVTFFLSKISLELLDIG